MSLVKRARKYVRNTLGQFARQSIKRDAAGIRAATNTIADLIVGPAPNAVKTARKLQAQRRKKQAIRKRR